MRHDVLFVAAIALALPATASAQDDAAQNTVAPPLSPEEKAFLERGRDRRMSERFAIRFGPAFNAMLGSGQGRPFTYPYIGGRYKTETTYIDLHLTGLFGALDAAQYFTQEALIQNPRAFNLFQTLNEPQHYAFFEALHVRAGRTFVANRKKITQRTESPDPEAISQRIPAPLYVSVGAVGIADFVLFDLALLDPSTNLEDINLSEIITSDPVVVGAGGFVAVGRKSERVAVDVALDIGYDMLDWNAYQRVRGFIISADVDLQLDLTPRFAFFARPRYSAYTHMRAPNNPNSTIVTTFMFTTGVLFHL